MAHYWHHGMVVLAVFVAVLAGGSGCTLDFIEDMALPDDIAPPDDVQPRSAEAVTIRFRNLTVYEAVDVEFYASDHDLETLPDDLFIPENMVTASIGVAGTGLVQPLQEDVIEFPCTSNMTIGTRGGRFVDFETGEPRGLGNQRWAQEGPLGLCGSVVTFVFNGDGIDFATTLTIGG